VEIPFMIGTGNVSYDGPYEVWVTDQYTPPGNLVEGRQDVLIGLVYIQYNITWKTKIIKNCAGFNTIEGWITRGNGQTVLVPLYVGIAYPDNNLDGDGIDNKNRLANKYDIAPNSSGQFALTFTVDPSADIGDFRVFVRDGYADGTTDLPAPYHMNGANRDNDAMIYEKLSNSPTDLSITASTYYSPVLLYKGVAEQPLLLQVVDQNGAYVQDATWTVSSGALFHQAPIEIAPGFYRFLLDIASPLTGDVRLTAHKMVYGLDKESTVVINLTSMLPETMAPIGRGRTGRR
jgi:hypothetical protein